jgi:hypothetical protein
MGELLSDRLPVPDRLARAFQGHTTLNLKKAAAALEMDERHLRAAVRAGQVRFVHLGQGQRPLRHHDERRRE